MTLTRYGLSTWGPLTLIAAVLAGGLALLGWRLGAGWWWGLIPVGLAWFAVASFFRDPIRRIPTGLPEGTMLSPADGVISAIETVDGHEATEGPTVIVRIFLSVLNVHVNRSPADGKVVAIRYAPGKFLDARSEASARVNEANLLTLRLDAGGETIGVRQVSGKLARRIVCPVSIGDHLKCGARFGMIKFGSTAELILPRPADVEVRVSVGDRVRGGQTVLAVLRPPSTEKVAGQSALAEAPIG